eukprot:1195480-Pyramimonas_sp.AAC.1
MSILCISIFQTQRTITTTPIAHVLRQLKLRRRLQVYEFSSRLGPSLRRRCTRQANNYASVVRQGKLVSAAMMLRPGVAHFRGQHPPYSEFLPLQAAADTNIVKYLLHPLT